MKSEGKRYLFVAIIVMAGSSQGFAAAHALEEERQSLSVLNSESGPSRSLDNFFDNQAQTSGSNEGRREFFISTGVGCLEFVGLGLGVQLGSELAIVVKSSVFFVSGSGFPGPPTATGIGIRTIVSIPDKPFLQGLLHFNALRIETSYLYRVVHEKARNKGVAMEITTGYENFKSQGASIYWSIGVAISAADGIEPLVFPALKIGVNWNF